ncbi:MAG: flagellar protein FlaG [Motiliproteus sp.]|jgi:flagellar protein FlaG
MVDSISHSATPAAVQQKTAQAPAAAEKPAVESVAPEAAVKQVEAATKVESASGSIEQAQASAEKLQASVDKLNAFMIDGQRSLSFSVEQANDSVVVRVSNRTTHELVRQIPTEEALAISEHLDRVLGMLFSEKV